MTRKKRELHSHPDFQGGKRHPITRSHRTTDYPEMHTETKAATRSRIKDAVVGGTRISDETREKNKKYIAQQRAELEEMDPEDLNPAQLETLKLCGECFKKLEYDPDRHYHTRKDGTPVCCKCVVTKHEVTCVLRTAWKATQGKEESGRERGNHKAR